MRRCPGRGNSKCKRPEVGTGLVFLRIKGAQQRWTVVRQSTCGGEGFCVSSATRASIERQGEPDYNRLPLSACPAVRCHGEENSQKDPRTCIGGVS